MFSNFSFSLAWATYFVDISSSSMSTSQTFVAVILVLIALIIITVIIIITIFISRQPFARRSRRYSLLVNTEFVVFWATGYYTTRINTY